MVGKANIGARITLDGEKEYRQAISNVSKSMNVLKSDLKAVSAEYEGNANSLEALRAKNDLYTKQQSEQEKKLQLLRGALEDATKQYGENSKQAQDWQIKLNNAYSELQKINRELDNNEKYMKEAEQSTDKTAKSIDEFGNKVKETKEETLKFGDVLKANLAGEAIIKGVEKLFSIFKEGGEALVNVVKDTAAYADNIMTLSTQTGIATDTLQELNYMAELTDTSIETITSSMARNIRAMQNAQQGTTEYVDAYRTLGVEITDANGQLRDSQTVFWDAVDALGKMSNETERDALAMQLFGRSAQDLNPLIKVGKDGMAEFAKEARDMGAVLSDDTLQGLGKTDDALQRLYQQFDVAKRKIAIEAAPAVTEAIGKISDKVGEADDEFAEFVSGGINGVVDGFVWIIDNIDLVIAGLKGVTAAFVTKKAAEGVEFAIQAYKTLTTVTQAATVAQTAFNTASKANVIGAIASVVIGLGTALYTYTESASEAAEETKRLSSETNKLYESAKRANEEISSNITSRKEETETFETQGQAISNLVDSLYDLEQQEGKTNKEKSQMAAIVKQLNDLVPDLNLIFDEQTGILNQNEESVRKTTDAYLELQRVQVAGQRIAQIEIDKLNAEKALNEAEAAKTARATEYQKALLEFDKSRTTGKIPLLSPIKESFDLKKAANAAASAGAEYIKAQDNINKLETEYADLMEYLGQHNPTGTIAQNSQAIVDQYKKSMEDNSSDAVDTVEDAVEKINGIYEDASDELNKRLKKERKAFEDNQKAEVKALEEAQKKELKTLEASHKKKLELIDEEYLEKMKNVDEDRYNELKKVQDQINAIDAQQEAEDRAAKLKEEADKRAELKSRVESAKTIEERLQAQEDLADFEDEVAKDRLKTERGLQKDILEDQKDTINDAYDAKIKALEEEQKKAKETVNTEYEDEKTLIDKNYQLKIEALEKEQQAEQDSFDDRQEAYKTYLEKQKELAIENAQKTYGEDLRLFKLNNALKEKEITSSDYMGALKNKDLYSGKSQISTDMLQSYMRYGNPTVSVQNQTTQELTIDYDEMVDAFSEALKKLNLTVVLDNKKVGSIVETTVNKMIR
jgi:hypothetical protein